MPVLISYSMSDKGLRRNNNEDCYLSAPEKGLWAVADGMGGHEAGEVASAIVRETLMQEIELGHSLEESILCTHTAVLNAVQAGRGSIGMGSTVVALSTKGREFQVSWVGDSRAYLWSSNANGGQLQQLSTDHSYVQMLLANGAINADEVDTHPDKHIITQCIGSPDTDTIKVDSIIGEWTPGQWIVLCSDGLTDELDNTALAQTLSEALNPADACKSLMQRALECGGRDNITIQVIESPLPTHPSLHRAHHWLPEISGSKWLDFTLYSLALVTVAAIALWSLL